MFEADGKCQQQGTPSSCISETKPDVRKVMLLLTIAGPQIIEVFNTFICSKPD